MDEDEETDDELEGDDEGDEDEGEEFTPDQLEAGLASNQARAQLSPNVNYARAPFSKQSLRQSLHRARSGERGGRGERQPLLGDGGGGGGPGTLSRGVSKTRHRRTKSGPPVGTASVTQAVLMVS